MLSGCRHSLQLGRPADSHHPTAICSEADLTNKASAGVAHYTVNWGFSSLPPYSRYVPFKLQSAAAQDRLTALMAQLFDQRTDLRDQLLLGLAAVGRGGQGDLGQRIRDEILVVQSKNNAKVRPAA